MSNSAGAGLPASGETDMGILVDRSVPQSTCFGPVKIARCIEEDIYAYPSRNDIPGSSQVPATESSSTPEDIRAPLMTLLLYDLPYASATLLLPEIKMLAKKGP